MADEVPEESEEYEIVQKIAVNGEVIGKLQMKPDPLTTEVEDKAASVALATLLGTLQKHEAEDEEVVELLETYDPEVQVWAADTNEDEPSWKPAAPISETELLDEYKQL